MHYSCASDCLERAQVLKQKLLKQGYVALSSTLKNVYSRHHELVDRYEISIFQIALYLFSFTWFFFLSSVINTFPFLDIMGMFLISMGNTVRFL
jgi:hypothetical protein